MKIKDLIAKLELFNPEMEVWQIYDGMPKPIIVGPAEPEDLEAINDRIGSEQGLKNAVVFWAG